MGEDIHTTAEAHEREALPRAHAVEADPEACRAAELRPLPPAIAKAPVAGKSAARWAYERLILYIKNFEEQLDSEHEVAMGFAGGHSGVLRIEGIGYFDPDIVTFYGRDGQGTRTQLIQHVSQLSVVLRAQPREAGQPAPTRIGFRLAADLETE